MDKYATDYYVDNFLAKLVTSEELLEYAKKLGSTDEVFLRNAHWAIARDNHERIVDGLKSTKFGGDGCTQRLLTWMGLLGMAISAIERHLGRDKAKVFRAVGLLDNHDGLADLFNALSDESPPEALTRAFSDRNGRLGVCSMLQWSVELRKVVDWSGRHKHDRVYTAS